MIGNWFCFGVVHINGNFVPVGKSLRRYTIIDTFVTLAIADFYPFIKHFVVVVVVVVVTGVETGMVYLWHLVGYALKLVVF
jgi:hypothetical protein